ncbi:dnaJ homolog subfamily C member 9 [Chelonus insularis]|uniref:dnaJ homolog subfamily C member 9 n=1 Tax=Chelonus insularis TaxID=460826 RepID=UPI001589EC33|nr:dnaJ homolog subfamily C member 9 [Chelonus insularis]
MAQQLVKSCEKYFGTRNFYEVLKISKNADEKQVKKAYHKLSLLVHPDRVDEKTKEEATEKFKVLSFIHSVLSDNDKRKIYDETGQYDEESEEVAMRNWADYWRSLFRVVTVEDIENYEKNYKGSETELKDLKRAYIDGKGDMDYIFEAVPFVNYEDESRLREIISKLIEDEEVPAFRAFTHENEKKKLRRKRKWAKEAKEAEQLSKMLKIEEDEKQKSTNDLALAIQNRNRERAGEAENFFDSLIEKYASKAEKSKKTKKTTTGKQKKKNS